MYEESDTDDDERRRNHQDAFLFHAQLGQEVLAMQALYQMIDENELDFPQFQQRIRVKHRINADELHIIDDAARLAIRKGARLDTLQRVWNCARLVRDMRLHGYQQAAFRADLETFTNLLLEERGAPPPPPRADLPTETEQNAPQDQSAVFFEEGEYIEL